jgi:predicted nucleic acid-binding Zn ribbon protein
MEYSIGDALTKFLQQSQWLPKIRERKLQANWETIVGKTIAKYTRNVRLTGNVLHVSTDIAVLKQELQMGKPQLMQRINEYFDAEVVKDIIIK